MVDRLREAGWSYSEISGGFDAYDDERGKCGLWQKFLCNVVATRRARRGMGSAILATRSLRVGLIQSCQNWV